MKENNLKNKAFKFAVRVVNSYKYLTENKKEYVLSKQLLRSGTSIGANAREADNAESKADFIHKLAIAQKEADETLYWLELMNETNYLDENQFKSLHNNAEELLKIIRTIILNTKRSK